ncbi:MAG: sigma 54-interacting transcriptional regulator [Nitrospirae bacterium]|nr:sigma 54-interacting transcriptional regulator [Nitrospirota bacterium]
MTKTDIILDSINDGLFTTDLDLKIAFFNNAAQELLGYKVDEVMGKHCGTILRCEACKMGCALKYTFNTGEPLSNYEAIIRNKEGKPIPISFSTALLKDEEGNVTGGVEIFRDLSLVKNLIEQLSERYAFGNIIGKNYKMQRIYDLIQQVAHTDTVVLITGESGTGKELIARAIHYNSSRKDKPFIKVDCASLVESLLESELFGHVKGAFTGAISDKAGRFELADGGTIFLDEIGNIGLTSQAKLLRVLQNGEFERVGESKTNKVDVRVIAATNIDIKKAVREKKFREDLYYRLKVVSIHLPPLRERKEDIPLIVRHFVDRFNKSMGKEVINIFPGAMEMLMRYNYPGNIRELENIIEHAFIRCNGNTIFPHHLPEDFLHDEKGFIEGILKSKRPFEDLERRLILKVLDETNWAYQEAASRLGISRATLWRKIKKLGIKKENVADM